MDDATRDDELLGVEDVGRYLEVQATTIYRWCREGRLPCLKVGKSWRIRRSALDAFLRGAERRRTLEEHLRGFLTVPDFVIAIAEDTDLLMRLDAAFFKVGEAAGGILVKFHAGETHSVPKLRKGLREHGLDVDHLEADGRFRWSAEIDPTVDRATLLRGMIEEETSSGRAVWASFNWTKEVELALALAQQEAIASVVGENRVVVKTAALPEVAEDWSAAQLRQALHFHRGQIELTRAGLSMSRQVPISDI